MQCPEFRFKAKYENRVLFKNWGKKHNLDNGISKVQFELGYLH